MKQRLKAFFLSTAIIAGITSCSPRINENIYKKYSPTDPDRVKIFNPSDTIPTSAEVIGTLTVMENSFSDLRLRDVKTILCETTAKNGGNGFAIYDIYPAKRGNSACPYMSGMILYMKDTIIHKDSVHPLTQEIIQFQEKKKAKQLPHNNFTLGLGYGGIISEFYVPMKLTEGSLANGFVFDLGYRYIFPSGWFVGIDYTQYQSSAAFVSVDLNMRQIMVTPEVGFKRKVGRNWILGLSTGIGLFNYHEKMKENNLSQTYSVSGMATRIEADAEYLVHKNISIGVRTGLLTGVVKEDKTLSAGEMEKRGIRNFVFTIGPRFYF